jgi:Type II CAAX prenyl endopeptidase Rce1-like
MNTYWYEFTVLFGLAIIGSLALVPYTGQLLKKAERKKPSKLSDPALLFVSFLQNVIISAITVGVGLLLAHKIGLDAQYIHAWVNGKPPLQPLSYLVTKGAVFGVLAGLVLIIGDLCFLPHLPKKLQEMAKSTSQLQNFTASFYGGINEEFLTRFLGMSLLAWLLAFAWHTTSSAPTSGVFWAANIIMALIFAVGHLPALKAVAGSVTGLLLARTFILNVPIGILCGWLFWKYGIEMAVMAHFSADIVYHVGGTVILRKKLNGI